MRPYADDGVGKFWVNKYPNSAEHLKPAMPAKDVTNRFTVGRRERWSESGMNE